VNFSIQHSELRDIHDQVVAGRRISEADALRLFESKDLNAVGTIADFVCRKKVGSRASYIVNRYINYSNYCILSCRFCSFARKLRDGDGGELTVPQIVERRARRSGSASRNCTSSADFTRRCRSIITRTCCAP